MTRLWAAGLPIWVAIGSDGSPRRFRWQAYTYRVEAIQQRWQIDTDWWEPGGRIWRDYLALTTKEGLLCVIYQDLLTDQWYLAKTYD